MRRIFIGDIQGCLGPLERLLRRLAPGSGDCLWAVGDVVNRGPDSLGVLRRLRAIGARSVLGNHDLRLLRAARGAAGDVPPALRAVLDADDAGDLLAWLAAQPVLQVDEDLIVVHGGLDPRWTDLDATAAALARALPDHLAGSDEAGIVFATQVRHCTADGTRPLQDEPPPGPPFHPWDHWYRGTRTVVFGHWARRGLVTGARVRGLDTGCVYGGPLTAWVAEEDRLVQVPGEAKGTLGRYGHNV